MAYSIKCFLKTEKHSTNMTLISEFSLSDVIKHIKLNVFVKIPVVSYKSNYSLQWIYINGYTQCLQILYRD